MAAAVDSLSVMGDVGSYYAAVYIGFVVAAALVVAAVPVAAAYHDNQRLHHHHSLHHLAAVPADHHTPFAVAENHTLPADRTVEEVLENLRSPSGLVAALASAASAASAEALPGSWLTWHLFRELATSLDLRPA